jgi:trk system potassium uptake protein TrkH
MLPDHPSTGEVPNVRASAKRFVLAFTVLVLIGAVLLALPWTTESGESTEPTDAFFTAVSAASVTGLIVVDTQEHWNLFGEIVLLVLIQVGGLGFMVGASIVLASIGRSLTLRDSLLLQDGAPTLSLAEATQLSKRILIFIFVFEAVGAVIMTTLLLIDGRGFWVALWHGVFTSVSSFCNAGFDLEGGFQSVIGLSDSFIFTTTSLVLIQAGALSYISLSDAWAQKRWRKYALDTKLVLLANAILLVGGALLFLVLEWGDAMSGIDVWLKPLTALYQSASVRTAGFAAMPFEEVHPATIFLSIGIMMVGGAAGSTTGGVKLATIAIVVIAVISTVRGQTDAQAFGRRIGPQLVFRAMAVITLFLFAHFLLTLGVAISEDVVAGNEFGFLALMLEAMSAIATAGVSTGITPGFSVAGKLLLCVGMFVGRLGPLTAIYALQRSARPALYRFPEAPIRIG